MEEVVDYIRHETDLIRPFKRNPLADKWLLIFEQKLLRYPILIVLGPSHYGKTEWVKSLFSNPLDLPIGVLEQFPDRLRTFRRGFHDGIVLDDVRDLDFLARNQEIHCCKR